MTVAIAVAIATMFVWLGMVLAISFMEAPLKFRAPGLTLPVGLGIGRIVFRALNAAEGVLAIVVAVTVSVALTAGSVGLPAVIAAAVPVVVLVAQLLLVRPRLTRRTDAVLAGHTGARSKAHHAYIATEAVKVIALITAGVMMLGTGL